ncbi:Tetratricopeptide repeat (TPR)-like superfamily protein isoform 4 [Gossypium australe]|uniref:Tetratricopeptide repeat (TPR)-like superfamily protein isoform 4 n=1 Tax=Gossypium australe TaxID=47621 RepID=A0A5B6W9C9_9ROSI|nr:Tetratricopeptide repeat (TPR)-like superfamily protein isoform 4 [Gossypium australe]
MWLSTVIKENGTFQREVDLPLLLSVCVDELSVNPPEEAAVIDKKLSREQKAILETRLARFEATLSTSPKDETALEGAAVTLTELGDYARATSLLQELAKVKTSDPEVFRLLGEVKYELKDYDGSAAAYKLSAARNSARIVTLRELC